jgi:hypothetical protein
VGVCVARVEAWGNLVWVGGLHAKGGSVGWCAWFGGIELDQG